MKSSVEDWHHKLQSPVSWCGLVVRQCGALVYICGDKFIIPGMSAVCHCLYSPKPAATTGVWQICVYVCARESPREKDGSPQGALTLNDLVSKWFNETKDWYRRVTMRALPLVPRARTAVCMHWSPSVTPPRVWAPSNCTSSLCRAFQQHSNLFLADVRLNNNPSFACTHNPPFVQSSTSPYMIGTQWLNEVSSKLTPTVEFLPL